jgi:iron(III) transport system permease protein
LFSSVFGGAMAWLTYRTDFRYKKLLVAAIGLSFFFPGFILAMAWVILGSPGGIFNSILSDWLNIGSVQFDIYSVTGIIWIQVLHITPFAFFTVRGPLSSMDSSLEEAAYASGASFLCLLYALLSFIIPSIALVYTSAIKYFVANPFEASYTWRNYQQILDSPGTVRAFSNTLIVAGGGAVFGLVLGTLIAYSTHRLKRRGHRALDMLASLPFGIPGIVIGLGFLWSYVYLPIYGALWVLVFCYVARFLPYATETIGAQVVQIDRVSEEAAWTSDANRVASFGRIMLPLLRPALQSGYFLLFIAYFREIAAAALIYTSSTQVLSISIWAFFENANWGVASALSIVTSVTPSRLWSR